MYLLHINYPYSNLTEVLLPHRITHPLLYIVYSLSHNDEREVNDAFLKRQKQTLQTSHEIPFLRIIISLYKNLIQYLGILCLITLILVYRYVPM